MTSATKVTILIEHKASDLAFRLGQLLERMLIDRAIESGTPIITAEQVESCLNQDLFDDLLSRVGEVSHGESAGKDRASGQSWEAA